MASQLPAHKSPRTLPEVLKEVVHRRESLEVVFVDTRQVSCEGIGGALGHPKVFYNIGDKGYVECMYCDRVYVYEPARAGEIAYADDLSL